MKEFYDTIREFDKKRQWDDYDKEMTQEERINYLFYLLTCTLGEFGEFANEVKKCHRDKTWKDQELKEELTDTFIFLLKLSMTLKMDLSEEFYKKIEKNEKRFAHFITDKKTR